MIHRDFATEVKRVLNNPLDLCAKLNLLEGHKRQSRGVLIRCPSHGEKNPSCSVTVSPENTIRVKCFACDFSGDALSLVAFMHNLSLSSDFVKVLDTGATLAGDHSLASEIRGESETRTSIPAPVRLAPALSVAPASEYPTEVSLARLWGSCVDPSSDAETVRMLYSRGINFGVMSDLRLARVIPPGLDLPRWARYRGDANVARTWVETGHRLLLPAYDCAGVMRSVRSWRVRDGDTPKRLPPSGCKSSELVQANRQAVLMLRRWYQPNTLFIVEGEPDMLSAATTFARDDAVIGIGSGGWTEGFANAVPPRTRVYVATHADRAGDAYAEHIIKTLGEKRLIWRLRLAA